MEQFGETILPEQPSRSESKPLVRKKFLATVLILGAVFFSVFKFWLMPVKILGESMYPTYRNGTRHFLNRMAYWSAQPQRGDVIGMRAPDDDLYIKRIIGLPGDTVAITNATIFVNGAPFRDPLQAPVPRESHPTKLGSDEYWVIGDNRFISVFGPIDRKQILGKIVF
jgi:signal peptidase I